MSSSYDLPISTEKNFSCWISLQGRMYFIEGSFHYKYLMEHLELFGFTKRYVRQLLKWFLGDESQVSEKLMKSAYLHGWIRLRDYGRRFGIVLNNLRSAQNRVISWAVHMVEEGRGDSIVTISDWEDVDRIEHLVGVEYKVEDIASGVVDLSQRLRREKMGDGYVMRNGKPVYDLPQQGGRRQVLKSVYLQSKALSRDIVNAMCDCGVNLDEAHELLDMWVKENPILSSIGPHTLAEWKLYEKAKKMHDGGFSYLDAVGILAREAGVSHRRVRDIIGTAEEWRMGYFDMGLEPLVSTRREHQAVAELVASEVEPIQSMGVTVRKKRTGLPVNVWLDDEAAYLRGGHGKRIKFQSDKGDHPNTDNFATMTISGSPRVIGEHDLSSRDIQQLKDFVVKNRVLLEQLSDQIIDYDDFAVAVGFLR